MPQIGRCSWPCLSTPASLFFFPRPAFSTYVLAVQARTVSFVGSQPAEGEPDSAEASGSRSPAILPDGDTPACQEQINRILQKYWVGAVCLCTCSRSIFFLRLQREPVFTDNAAIIESVCI